MHSLPPAWSRKRGPTFCTVSGLWEIWPLTRLKAHRTEELVTAMDVVEHLLLDVYILPSKAKKLPKSPAEPAAKAERKEAHQRVGVSKTPKAGP